MLPWAEMLRAALMRGLSPVSFWSLSVREWVWLSGSAPSGLNREAFQALYEEHPDG